MPKGSHSRDPREQARRKLVNAQLELRLAQEKRASAISRGEEDVREAQEVAAQRVRRATERVERRAAEVARAEAQLRELSS